MPNCSCWRASSGSNSLERSQPPSVMEVCHPPAPSEEVPPLARRRSPPAPDPRPGTLLVAADIGLAIDGTTGGRCRAQGCGLCRPFRHPNKVIVGYRHHWAMISVVGRGLSLPFDVEPYRPADSEYAAGQRLLRRAVAKLGPRFADYVVVDGEFATAPLLHVADQVGLRVVARLKENLPELLAAAQKRFGSTLVQNSTYSTTCCC